MKDLTGVEIQVGARIAMFRPYGGALVGVVEDVGTSSVCVSGRIEVRPDLTQRRAARWSEIAMPSQVLVLK